MIPDFIIYFAIFVVGVLTYHFITGNLRDQIKYLREKEVKCNKRIGELEFIIIDLKQKKDRDIRKM